MLLKQREELFAAIQDASNESIEEITGKSAEIIEGKLKDAVVKFEEEVQGILEEAKEALEVLKSTTYKGDPGKNFTFADITEEQKMELRGKDADEEIIISKVLEKIPPAEKVTLPNVASMIDDAIVGYFIKNPLEKNKEVIKEVEKVNIKERAEEIARAIEALPEEKKLDYHKGLKNEPGVPAYNTTKTSRKGGGGLGDTQHESKAVSSATTSITTNSDIGGGTFALWAYYQGQLIMRGVHYTVSGLRTLNLLFTPQDDTTIDLIYIR